MNDAVLPDAYHAARIVKPGCQHNLGCRCGVPYHLRESTPAEQRIEERLRQVFSTVAPLP